MSTDPRSPCIIGVARRTWHPDETPDGAPEPLAMWEEMARAAADDAGCSTDPLAQLESIDVVFTQSWQYDDPAGRLAARLGIAPKRQRYSGIGGTIPQILAAEVAGHISQGELDLALVVGAEALATVRNLAKQGNQPEWSFPPEKQRPFPMNLDFHPSEISHAVFEAYLTFALFDNARRAKLGRALPAHRTALGRVLAPMTAVAAASPHAWFPRARGVEEIIDPRADNRMVAYPYTKLMTAIMDVDMAAGLLLASAAKADSLGVPEELRVYLRGWGYEQESEHVAGHPDLWRSPAMAQAARTALEAGGIGADDVAHFDLYSCFASSICFGRDALGIAEEDARSVTQTGGLPYHGGPGSNYMTHSLAAMAETLRTDPGSFGLVSGVGMHMMKHVYGLWSTTPGALPAPGPVAPRPRPEAAITASPSGAARVATYAVLHGRDGAATNALLVCDLPDGTRCYARLDGGEAALTQAESEELIGRTVTLTPDGAINHASL
jgi:acetyl-CoA C-acetyltransferase